MIEWIRVIIGALAILLGLIYLDQARADTMQDKTIEAVTKVPAVKRAWKRIERRYIPEVVMNVVEYLPYVEPVKDIYYGDKFYLRYKWRFE